MIGSIFLASALAIATRARQQPAPELDELQPCQGVFSTTSNSLDPYYQALARGLLEEGGIRECELLTVPSFEREWTVYLRREDRESPACLILRRMKVHLWSQMMDVLSDHHTKDTIDLGPVACREALSCMPLDVEVFTAPLASETIELLEQIWSRMLGRVRYPEVAGGGLDGENYYFAHWDWQTGPRCGETWTPHEGTRVAALVEIAEKLAEIAQAPPPSRAALETAVLAQARALLDRLDREPENAK